VTGQSVAGLELGEARGALEAFHARSVMGCSRALSRDMAEGLAAAALAASLGSPRALLNQVCRKSRILD